MPRLSGWRVPVIVLSRWPGIRVVLAEKVNERTYRSSTYVPFHTHSTCTVQYDLLRTHRAVLSRLALGTSFFSRKSVDSNRFSLDPLPQHTLNQSIQQSNNPTTENQKFCTSRIASLLRNYVRLLWAVKVDVKPCPLPRVPHYIPQPMNINR